MYITNEVRPVVWSVSRRTGWLRPLAGTGVPAGPLGDGGPALGADVEGCGTAVDHFGDLVIADCGFNQVRVVAARTGSFYGQQMTAGDIYTVAGNGKAGFSGDGGPATSAELNGLNSVAVDAAGNLVIADSNNYRVRVVAASTATFYGQQMTTGDIYTVAGDGTFGSSGDGGPATSAELAAPGGVTVDATGNLVIADTFSHRVRVVAASTATFYGQQMTAGDIYTVAGGGTGGLGDGGPATSAELAFPVGVAVDAAGNLVIADESNNRVRVVAVSTGMFYEQQMTAGDIYTVAGDGTPGLTGGGGPATSAELHFPISVAVDAAGNVVIADSGNYRVRVVAASTGMFYGQQMTAGDIYTMAGNGAVTASGSGRAATTAQITFPEDVTTDAAGNMLIADSHGRLVRVVAARTGVFYGQQMTAGDIYNVAGDGTRGFSGDGGPATRAELNIPEGVATDAAGNLIIADAGNNRVRVVAAHTGTFYGKQMTAGDIYTVAGDRYSGFSGDGGPATRAALRHAGGVGSDAAGNLIIADTGNGRVRVVAARTGTFYGQRMTAGDIYSIAVLGNPAGVAVDGAGNLVIADYSFDRVWVVAARTGTFYGQKMTIGHSYGVAGDGHFGFSGDGGPATSAEMAFPEGVAVDGAGNLVIADTFNARVRVVAARTGTFYGQKMTAGHIYTVAGDGIQGFSGDGGPATSAELANPDSVAVNAAGNLLITDAESARIRMVTR